MFRRKDRKYLAKPTDEDRPGYASPKERAADRQAAAWLWGALALQVDKGAEVIALLRGAQDDELSAVAQWLELGTATEDERRPMRWSLRMSDPQPAVLPAVMVISCVNETIIASLGPGRPGDCAPALEPTGCESSAPQPPN